VSLVFHGIRIRNFGSYTGEHQIDFRRSPGLYYVRGANQVNDDLESNGAGKSTLFNALTWCLYGKTLRDERPGDSVEPWTGESPTLVAVVVQRDGTYYCVTRQRRPNKLMLDTNREGPVECDQDRIDETIGLPFKLFRCTIMLPQFGAMFLDLPPDEQASMFSDALDLDLWLRSADIAGALLKDVKASIAEIQNTISRNAGRLAEIDANIAAERDDAQTFDDATMAESVEIARKLRECELEAVRLNELPKPAPDQASARIEADITASTALRFRLQASLSARNAEMDRMQREQRDLSNKLTAYKSGGKCPECGQAMPAAHIAARRKPLADRLAALNAQIGNLAAVVRQEADELEAISGKLADLDAALKKSRKAYELKNAAAIKNAASLEALRVEIGNLRASVKRLKNLVNPHKARVAELTKRKADIEAEQQRCAADHESHEMNAALYENWQTWFRQIRLDIIDGCLREIETIATKEAEAMGLKGWQLEIATERETSEGKIARKMAVMLYPPGSAKPVRLQSYCGGEDQRWQLAIRFALSEILLAAAGIEPSVEILDEPSIHVSPRGVEDLMVFLRERAHRLGRELLVVEHHLLDENLFDGVLEVTKDAEGSRAQWTDRPYHGRIADDPIFASEPA
jgi:DNA repair exonuclease SbcCD ATPase subunit